MSETKKPFVVDWDLTTSDEKVIELVNTIYTDLNLGTQKVKIKKELLKTVLMNLLLSTKTERGVRYSRNNDWYQNLPSKYKYDFQTYHMVTKVADALLDKEYINHLMGSWDMLSNFKDQSEMKPAPKLVKLFDGLSADVIEYKAPVQEIILRSKIIIISTDRKTGKKIKIKKQIQLDYPESPNTIAIRKVIKDWNSLRSRTEITLEIPKEMYDADDDQDRFTYYCKLLEEEGEVVKFKVTPKGAYRVFREDLEHFGRFSAATETLIRKRYRPHFKINGEPTVELDFEAMHIRMLYNMEGIDYQDDPYRIAAESFENPEFRSRKLFKKIGLISINAKDRTDTVKAVRHNLWIKNETGNTTYEILESMLDHWMVTQVPISKYLCTKIGLELMYKDSCIAEKVIKHFTEKGVMVMCVHDSFIIERKYESELKSVMESAYREVMGSNFRVYIDSKLIYNIYYNNFLNYYIFFFFIIIINSFFILS